MCLQVHIVIAACSGPIGADTPIRLIMEALGVFMAKKARRRFFDEFKLDALSLVADQRYFIFETAQRRLH